MRDELSTIRETFGLSDDDALFVLELCDMLAREDAIATHGYPKDTPGGRDLAHCLGEADYRARLLALARSEGAGETLLQSLA